MRPVRFWPRVRGRGAFFVAGFRLKVGASWREKRPPVPSPVPTPGQLT